MPPNIFNIDNQIFEQQQANKHQPPPSEDKDYAMIFIKKSIVC